MWQDYIFLIAGLLFTVALLPSLFSTNKPALSTSIMNVSVLAVVSLTHISLGLWLAAFSCIANASVWMLLAAQQLMIQKSQET